MKADSEQDRFDKEFKEGADLCKVLSKYIKQKVSKKEGQRAYSPAQIFCKKLCENLESKYMKLYFKTLAENCTFWAAKHDSQKIPVVFPQRIRMHAEDEKKKQIGGEKAKIIDRKGFGHQSNPIYDIARTRNRNKNRGRLIFGDFNYKGLRLDEGFEACHIWYDTTEAPPLFTFIPNVVWMPQIIARLSDEVVKNTVFPPLLKHLSYAYYKKKKPKKSAKSQGKKPSKKQAEKPTGKSPKKPAEKQTEKPSENLLKKPAKKQTDKPTEKSKKKPSKKIPKKLLKPIINGAWQSLRENDDIAYSAEKIHEEPKVDKFSHFYVDRRLVMKTSKRIKKNIDYIDRCKKIAEKTDPSEVNNKKNALYELYKEEKRKEGKTRVKPLKDGKETKPFRDWHIQQLKDQWEADPILNEKDEDADKPDDKVPPKPKGKENEDKFLKRTLNKNCYNFIKESLQQDGKQSYSAALKKMIIESYVTNNNFEVIRDLEKWLNSYYRVLTTIGDSKKKKFVEDIQNPKVDIGKKYGLNKEEIQRNISETLGPDCPNNVEGARDYLRKDNRPIEKILQESKESRKKKPDPKEGLIIKDPKELNMFVVRLCGKEGTPKKKK